MPLISTMTVPALQDLVIKSYNKETMREADDVRKVFIKATADWTTDRKRIQEIDRERYAEQKVEGQPSAQRGISQGYSKEAIRKTVSVTRIVSGEEYKALEAHDLASYAATNAGDVIDKIELDMRNFLGYATQGTSYVDNGGFVIDLTGGDGLSIFDTTHTLKNSTTTYSNILSGAPSFSDTALEAAEDYFSYNVTDNNGQRLNIKADTIITTARASMINRVNRLFGSMSQGTINGVANGNSGVKNPYRDRFEHIVVDFDVDALGRPNANLSYYWFLAALKGEPAARFQAWYISWMSPMVAPPEVNQDKWIMSWTGRAAYAIAAVSGKGIVVSKATS